MSSLSDPTGPQAAGHDPDPPPVPPEKPLPAECCESGCPICVYDLYAEALDDYRQRRAAWIARHPEATPPPET
ncbi:oxidoreductase-like domain-containing protein [Pseudoxanthomonas suwonensis]|uniref:oxidoreductase-like domain-containing protein n=1 Tax=Pseudoxanthomonas suwonensis TaxID=314722 RepID=UPI00048A9BFC|nr:oxidoreductase-like domain-containing protein [Pseudoxanthomonas suwonensis]